MIRLEEIYKDVYFKGDKEIVEIGIVKENVRAKFKMNSLDDLTKGYECDMTSNSCVDVISIHKLVHDIKVWCIGKKIEAWSGYDFERKEWTCSLKFWKKDYKFIEEKEVKKMFDGKSEVEVVTAAFLWIKDNLLPKEVHPTGEIEKGNCSVCGKELITRIKVDEEIIEICNPCLTKKLKEKEWYIRGAGI